MISLSGFMSERLVYAFGWSLVHSLWQGLLATLILWVVLEAAHQRTAQFRYMVSVFALMMVFTAWLFTFAACYRTADQVGFNASVQVSAVSPHMTTPAAMAGAAPSAANLSPFREAAGLLNHNLDLLVAFWLMGLSLLSIRFMGGLVYTSRLKHRCTAPVPPVWRTTLKRLADSAGLRAGVRLMESAIITTPMVVGHFKPVILLPVGAVTGLPTRQLEAILLHELAHIVRRDYLVNLFQSVLEILFFFNPATWWISTRIRAEREHCCDDIAVRLSGDPITFSKALANIQEVPMKTPQLAMAASGPQSPLLIRIKRLTGSPVPAFNTFERGIAAAVLLSVLLTTTLYAKTHAEEVTPPPKPKVAEQVVAPEPTPAPMTEPTPAAPTAEPAPMLMPTPSNLNSPPSPSVKPSLADSPLPEVAPTAIALATPPAYTPGAEPTATVRPMLANPPKAEPGPGPTAPPALPEPVLADPPEAPQDDTVLQGNVTIKGTINEDSGERDITLKMKDGEIEFIKVDGQAVPKEQWGDYQTYIDEILQKTERLKAREHELRNHEKKLRKREAEMRETMEKRYARLETNHEAREDAMREFDVNRRQLEEERRALEAERKNGATSEAERKELEANLRALEQKQTALERSERKARDQQRELLAREREEVRRHTLELREKSRVLRHEAREMKQRGLMKDGKVEIKSIHKTEDN